MSAAKFAVDKDCLWTNKKAKKITKISISYATGDGKLPIKDIIVYDDYSAKFTSGTTVTVGEAQGTTVFDVKEDANVTYSEYTAKDGVLSYSSKTDYAGLFTYTLDNAVSVGENSVIKIRAKGGFYITLKDSSGKNICQQIKRNGGGWWDNSAGYGWAKDGDTGYYFVTIVADKITNKSAIKQVKFDCSQANQVGYIDYIAVVG